MGKKKKSNEIEMTEYSSVPEDNESNLYDIEIEAEIEHPDVPDVQPKLSKKSNVNVIDNENMALSQFEYALNDGKGFLSIDPKTHKEEIGVRFASEKLAELIHKQAPGSTINKNTVYFSRAAYEKLNFKKLDKNRQVASFDEIINQLRAKPATQKVLLKNKLAADYINQRLNLNNGIKIINDNISIPFLANVTDKFAFADWMQKNFSIKNLTSPYRNDYILSLKDFLKFKKEVMRSKSDIELQKIAEKIHQQYYFALCESKIDTIFFTVDKETKDNLIGIRFDDKKQADLIRKQATGAYTEGSKNIVYFTKPVFDKFFAQSNLPGFDVFYEKFLAMPTAKEILRKANPKKSINFETNQFVLQFDKNDAQIQQAVSDLFSNPSTLHEDISSDSVMDEEPPESYTLSVPIDEYLKKDPEQIREYAASLLKNYPIEKLEDDSLKLPNTAETKTIAKVLGYTFREKDNAILLSVDSSDYPLDYALIPSLSKKSQNIPDNTIKSFLSNLDFKSDFKIINNMVGIPFIGKQEDKAAFAKQMKETFNTQSSLDSSEDYYLVSYSDIVKFGNEDFQEEHQFHRKFLEAIAKINEQTTTLLCESKKENFAIVQDKNGKEHIRIIFPDKNQATIIARNITGSQQDKSVIYIEKNIFDTYFETNKNLNFENLKTTAFKKEKESLLSYFNNEYTFDLQNNIVLIKLKPNSDKAALSRILTYYKIMPNEYKLADQYLILSCDDAQFKLPHRYVITELLNERTQTIIDATNNITKFQIALDNEFSLSTDNPDVFIQAAAGLNIALRKDKDGNIVLSQKNYEKIRKEINKDLLDYAHMIVKLLIDAFTGKEAISISKDGDITLKSSNAAAIVNTANTLGLNLLAKDGTIIISDTDYNILYKYDKSKKIISYDQLKKEYLDKNLNYESVNIDHDKITFSFNAIPAFISEKAMKTLFGVDCSLQGRTLYFSSDAFGKFLNKLDDMTMSAIINNLRGKAKQIVKDKIKNKQNTIMTKDNIGLQFDSIDEAGIISNLLPSYDKNKKDKTLYFDEDQFNAIFLKPEMRFNVINPFADKTKVIKQEIVANFKKINRAILKNDKLLDYEFSFDVKNNNFIFNLAGNHFENLKNNLKSLGVDNCNIALNHSGYQLELPAPSLKLIIDNASAYEAMVNQHKKSLKEYIMHANPSVLEKDNIQIKSAHAHMITEQARFLGIYLPDAQNNTIKLSKENYEDLRNFIINSNELPSYDEIHKIADNFTEDYILDLMNNLVKIPLAGKNDKLPALLNFYGINDKDYSFENIDTQIYLRLPLAKANNIIPLSDKINEKTKTNKENLRKAIAQGNMQILDDGKILLTQGATLPLVPALNNISIKLKSANSNSFYLTHAEYDFIQKQIDTSLPSYKEKINLLKENRLANAIKSLTIDKQHKQIILEFDPRNELTEHAMKQLYHVEGKKQGNTFILSPSQFHKLQKEMSQAQKNKLDLIVNDYLATQLHESYFKKKEKSEDPVEVKKAYHEQNRKLRYAFGVKKAYFEFSNLTDRNFFADMLGATGKNNFLVIDKDKFNTLFKNYHLNFKHLRERDEKAKEIVMSILPTGNIDGADILIHMTRNDKTTQDTITSALADFGVSNLSFGDNHNFYMKLSFDDYMKLSQVTYPKFKQKFNAINNDISRKIAEKLDKSYFEDGIKLNKTNTVIINNPTYIGLKLNSKEEAFCYSGIVGVGYKDDTIYFDNDKFDRVFSVYSDRLKFHELTNTPIKVNNVTAYDNLKYDYKLLNNADALSYCPFYEFYDSDKPNYCLTNFFNASFTLSIDGKDILFKTPEHYLLYQKFENNEAAQLEVLNAATATDALEVNFRHQLTPENEKKWKVNSYEAQLKVAIARVNNDPKFKETLLATKDAYLLNDSHDFNIPGNEIHMSGAGPDGMGENRDGLVLMTIREILKKNGNIKDIEELNEEAHLEIVDSLILLRDKARKEREEFNTLKNIPPGLSFAELSQLATIKPYNNLKSDYKLLDHGLNYCPFYEKGKPNEFFSNYIHLPLTLSMNGKNITFASPEHYFQYQKFDKDPAAQAAILNAKYSLDALKVNLTYHLPEDVKKQWNDTGFVEAMLKVVVARVKNDPRFEKSLLATGDAYIVEDSYIAPSIKGAAPDEKRGAGPTGRGENLLGLSLMTVREALKNNSDINNLNVIPQAMYDLREKARKEREEFNALTNNPVGKSFDELTKLEKTTLGNPPNQEIDLIAKVTECFPKFDDYLKQGNQFTIAKDSSSGKYILTLSNTDATITQYNDTSPELLNLCKEIFNLETTNIHGVYEMLVMSYAKYLAKEALTKTKVTNPDKEYKYFKIKEVPENESELHEYDIEQLKTSLDALGVASSSYDDESDPGIFKIKKDIDSNILNNVFNLTSLQPQPPKQKKSGYATGIDLFEKGRLDKIINHITNARWPTDPKDLVADRAAIESKKQLTVNNKPSSGFEIVGDTINILPSSADKNASYEAAMQTLKAAGITMVEVNAANNDLRTLKAMTEAAIRCNVIPVVKPNGAIKFNLHDYVIKSLDSATQGKYNHILQVETKIKKKTDKALNFHYENSAKIDEYAESIFTIGNNQLKTWAYQEALAPKNIKKEMKNFLDVTPFYTKIPITIDGKEYPCILARMLETRMLTGNKAMLGQLYDEISDSDLSNEDILFTIKRYRDDFEDNNQLKKIDRNEIEQELDRCIKIALEQHPVLRDKLMATNDLLLGCINPSEETNNNYLHPVEGKNYYEGVNRMGFALMNHRAELLNQPKYRGASLG